MQLASAGIVPYQERGVFLEDDLGEAMCPLWQVFDLSTLPLSEGLKSLSVNASGDPARLLLGFQ